VTHGGKLLDHAAAEPRRICHHCLNRLDELLPRAPARGDVLERAQDARSLSAIVSADTGQVVASPPFIRRQASKSLTVPALANPVSKRQVMVLAALTFGLGARLACCEASGQPQGRSQFTR